MDRIHRHTPRFRGRRSRRVHGSHMSREHSRDIVNADEKCLGECCARSSRIGRPQSLIHTAKNISLRGKNDRQIDQGRTLEKDDPFGHEYIG